MSSPSYYHYQEQHNDYADPFAVPAPQLVGSENLGYDFSKEDERPYSDLTRGNSKNGEQYSVAGDSFHNRSHSTSKPPPFLEDAPDADLARNAAGFGHSGAYQDLGLYSILALQPLGSVCLASAYPQNSPNLMLLEIPFRRCKKNQGLCRGSLVTGNIP